MKNLETEYKEHISEEMPDLWDRIEKNLPEKKPDNKKKISFVSVTKYMGVAAAAVFLLVLIPGVLQLRKGDTAKLETTTECAPDMFDAEMLEQTTTEAEVGTESAGTMVDGSSPQEMLQGDATETDSQQGAVGGEAPETAVTESETTEYEATEPVSGSIAEQESEVLEVITGEFTVTEVLVEDAVTVYVLQGNDMQTGDLQEIRAVMADDAQISLEAGASYLLTLTPAQDAAWDYVISLAE